MSTDLVNLPQGEIVARDAKGLWLPGSSPNPGGRPKAKHITEALRNKLEDGDAECLADEAISLAKTAKPAVRLGAITFIKEAVEGKATQQIRIEQTLDNETVQLIAALASKL